MSETLLNPEQSPEHVPQAPPESEELLQHLENQGENRGNDPSKIRLNDIGVNKAASELFANVRAVNNIDSESGGKVELSEIQKKEIMNQLLKETQTAIDSGDIDPNNAVENILKKAISGE